MSKVIKLCNYNIFHASFQNEYRKKTLKKIIKTNHVTTIFAYFKFQKK